MGRVSRSFVGVALIVAATQAAADDLAPAPTKPGPHHAAKSKTVKGAHSQSSGLADAPFSNPYAPPRWRQQERRGGIPSRQDSRTDRSEGKLVAHL